MNESQLHDAIGQLPEELLVPAERLRTRGPRAWLSAAAVAAACLCLLLSLPMAMGNLMSAGSKANDGAPMEPMKEMADFSESEQEHLFADIAAGSQFLATVIRVDSWGILVEPLEDAWERSSADRIEVSFANLQERPQLEPGDLVRITYSGTLQESYPARAVDVTDVDRLG